MDYYVYIDESGQFKKTDEEGVKSIVGGIITTIDVIQIENRLFEAIDNVNKIFNTDFSSKDIHISPLLHPETAMNIREKERFSSIPENARQTLADECLSVVKSLGEKFIFSTNEGFSFGIQDAQSRYGAVLCAFIHKLIDFVNRTGDISSLKIYIAPRSKKCLPDGCNYSGYHEKMTQYITSWIKKTLPNLKIGVGFGSKHRAGYDLADITCYYLRDNKKQLLLGKNKILKTAPNEHFTQTYLHTEEEVIEKLLKNHEYKAAYRCAESKERKESILERMAKQDEKIKIASVPELINYAYSLVEKRTVQKGALEEAIELFNHLLSICKTDSDNEKLTDMLLSAVNGILTCYNHIGGKGKQQKFLDFYKKNIISLLDIPYFTRQEKILSIRNRAYNNQFNNYDFQSIIDDFETVVQKRVADIPVYEKDYLTGEMLGTIGQAYAFLSKNHPENKEKAVSYFQQSKYHFIPGHRYHQMSVNYLTTIYWYHNELTSAKEAFAEHADIDGNKSVAQWIRDIVNAEEYHPGVAFNLSLLLRLAVSRGQVALKAIKNIEDFLKKCNINQHPYELIYKWLGLAYMNNNEYSEAVKAFDKSIAISKPMEFTIKTIMVSVIGLKCIALKKLSENDSAETDSLQKMVDDLTGESEHFAEYIESIGGMEQMLNEIATQNTSAVSKWMPFAYA